MLRGVINEHRAPPIIKHYRSRCFKQTADESKRTTRHDLREFYRPCPLYSIIPSLHYVVVTHGDDLCVL